MTESIENLIVEHLKCLEAALAAARERDSEMLAELGRLQFALAELRCDVEHFDERRHRAEPVLRVPS